MFDKFGEMDTFGEINELAENLFNEGDTASIKTMAKENGIDKEYVEMYLSGDIPVLCDAMTAALGKIDVEVADLKPKEIMKDWVEFHDGRYGAPGEKRQKRVKPTQEQIRIVNAQNKAKRCRQKMLAYFKRGDILATWTMR